MAEYRLYPQGQTPHVSTAEFHADRERAPHLEQGVHRPRLDKAVEFVDHALADMRSQSELEIVITVTDLGCGDGGLLQLLKDREGVQAWGYDFQPSNAAGWAERGVKAFALDVFGADREHVIPGEIVVCTEVLEHLEDPHGTVEWIAESAEYLVASSPHTETDLSHDACHAWAWDVPGYRELIRGGGFEIVRHETVGMFQVILGRAV